MCGEKMGKGHLLGHRQGSPPHVRGKDDENTDEVEV